MHRKGHLGATLALWSAIGFGLASVGFPETAAIALPIMGAVEHLPDADFKIPFMSHRGVSHTIWMALLIGVVTGLGGALLGDQLIGMGVADPRPDGLEVSIKTYLAMAGFVFGTLGVLSHYVADMLTPTGVKLFWPLSDTTYTIDVWTASNRIANTVLLIVGVLLAGAVGYYYIYPLL